MHRHVAEYTPVCLPVAGVGVYVIKSHGKGSACIRDKNWHPPWTGTVLPFRRSKRLGPYL